MNELTIERFGKRGDGVAMENGQEVFVPFSIPHETIKTEGRGKRRDIAEIITPSPLRVEAICQHFGQCGGCQMQHVEDAAYSAWKLALVTEPLTRAGIDVSPDPMIAFPVASRRKAVFNACRIDGVLHFGFSRRAENEVIDLEHCPILTDKLAAGITAARQLASSLPLGRKPARISLLAADNGLDIAIEDAPRLAGNQRNAFSQKAIDLGFLRASLDGEVIIEVQRPLLHMGKAMVCPPPAGFVQAVEDAENAMAKLVLDHLSKCKSVADLFCGMGTFALRLAERAKVLALEENPAAIESLDRAWRETGGTLKQVKAEARNLDRRPLTFQEIKKIDGIVFDPPREGAELQARQIAKSKVGRVAAVSCNPATLARDLKILIEGGYRVTQITPIDQFRFTPHVEAVALLER